MTLFSFELTEESTAELTALSGCIQNKTKNMLRYAKFSANNSLGITLLLQKSYFLSVKLCYLCCFS